MGMGTIEWLASALGSAFANILLAALSVLGILRDNPYVLAFMLVFLAIAGSLLHVESKRR